MKKLTLILFTLIALSCSENSPEIAPDAEFIQGEEPAAFSCINKQADNPPSLADAQKWIIGKWQLKGLISMIPNPKVPNLQVEFKADGGVFVSHMGKNVFTDAYSIVEKQQNDYKWLELINDNLLSNSEYRIVNGTIRICENELMVDQGIAFDAPGYLFRKIE